MNIEIIQETTDLAFEGKISFGEVVMKLIEIGVERYHADLVLLQKTFYTASGITETVELPLENAPSVAEDFDGDAVREAIRMAQQGEIHYPEFLERVMKAGCASYDVYIAGKQVIYFGRKGDFHIEKFPQN